jgi:methylglutamate dehydrogenase subunit A
VGRAGGRSELQRDAFSQRGLINLFHSDGQRDAFVRRGNAMLAQGDDAVLLDREGVRKMLPYLDFEQGRFPIYGGLYHPRGGTARHDAVAWGYARAADQRGVDLIENCEVTGIDISGGRVTGVQTTRGAISAKQGGDCGGGALQSGGGDGGYALAH